MVIDDVAREKNMPTIADDECLGGQFRLAHIFAQLTDTPIALDLAQFPV